MKTIQNFNKSKLDKYINCLFISSLIIYILINFFLINIEEELPYGYEIGQLISNLCIAYVTSFIFYILTFKIKELKDLQNIKPYLRIKLIKIISLKTGLNNTIINSAKLNTIELKKHYTRQNYQEYLEMFILGNQNIVTINPSIYNTEIEFTTFLLYQIKNINDEIDEIIMVSQAHHSELILLCCEIINSELVIFIINNVYNIQSERMTFNPFHIEQLSIWLEEYNMRINNLTKYLKKL